MSRRTDRDYFLGCETSVHDKHILQDGVLVTDILGDKDGPYATDRECGCYTESHEERH